MKKMAIWLNSLILLALTTTFFVAPANATSLVNSSPVGGSVLSLAPTAVTITANTDLTDGANEVTVLDPLGMRVDDGALQMQGATLTVGVKPLTATGVYTVNYTMMAVGEESLTSSFTFLFNAPAVIAEPTPSLSNPAEQPSDSASVNRTSDLLVIALLIFAIFILVLMVKYAKQTFKGSPTPRVRSIKKPGRSRKITK
jgi:methionine-rich copper-binding protein CopC